MTRDHHLTRRIEIGCGNRFAPCTGRRRTDFNNFVIIETQQGCHGAHIARHSLLHQSRPLGHQR